MLNNNRLFALSRYNMTKNNTCFFVTSIDIKISSNSYLKIQLLNTIQYFHLNREDQVRYRLLIFLIKDSTKDCTPPHAGFIMYPNLGFIKYLLNIPQRNRGLGEETTTLSHDPVYYSVPNPNSHLEVNLSELWLPIQELDCMPRQPCQRSPPLRNLIKRNKSFPLFRADLTPRKPEDAPETCRSEGCQILTKKKKSDR